MKTSIIIHGHFYQPPRENPYTGIVPNQSSAKPSANWNEAIYKTCYRPNAVSRYLANDGSIKTIYNNYINISSNLGQTLLDWIDSAHPGFISKLLKADSESIKKFGHSSIMAQGFNHTIMPLDSTSTKRIQTVWAVESYKNRFGHAPEGLWLAECAIDEETVDILAENNIRYVILAPWQAVAIDGVSTNGAPMPSDRAFIIKGKKSSINAFFYDGEFASGVSFGHMLRDADAMFNRLCKKRKERNNPDLIHWATDGEIYGHHEPFGDMGLAAFIRKISESNEFEIDNYASFLDKHPATQVATLGKGEEGLGTSWSCSHGVGRWMRNCGCHTGGDESWNQEWRGPLRKAFNNLENKVRDLLDAKMKAILGPETCYEDIILGYKAVVSHEKTVKEYVQSLTKANGKALSKNETIQIATMLEAFKNVMFSYTSCGWFFNDISGIEPRQNISYAVYAATLLDKMYNTSFCDELLKDLEKAKSNIVVEGTGADIARKDMPKNSGEAYACAYFAVNRRVAYKENFVNSFGFYRLVSIKDNQAKVLNTRTLKSYSFEFKATPYSSGALAYIITDKETGLSTKINLAEASSKTLETIASWVEDRLSSSLSEKFVDRIADHIGNYLVLLEADRSLAKDTVFIENIGSCIKALKYIILSDKNIPADKLESRIRQLLFFIRIKGRPIEVQEINRVFTLKLRRYGKEIKNNFTAELAQKTFNLLRVARSEGFNPDITKLQDAVFEYVGRKPEEIPQELWKDLLYNLNFSRDYF